VLGSQLHLLLLQRFDLDVFWVPHIDIIGIKHVLDLKQLFDVGVLWGLCPDTDFVLVLLC
jgi:hypothetical protein